MRLGAAHPKGAWKIGVDGMSRRVSRKRKTLITFLAVALIVGVIAMGCIYAFTGRTIYSCEDYVSITALDANATSVKSAAVLKIKFDWFVNDWKDNAIRMVIVDLTEMETNGTFNKIKMYIGDGTNEVYIGSAGDVGAIMNFEVLYDDLETTLSDGANVYFIMKTYDDSGNLANAWAEGDQEIAVEFTQGGGYQTVTGMIASGIISIIGTFKKAISGITGAIGSFLTALVTNEVVIILAVGIALVAVWFLFGPKKGYKRVLS